MRPIRIRLLAALSTALLALNLLATAGFAFPSDPGFGDGDSSVQTFPSDPGWDD